MSFFYLRLDNFRNIASFTNVSEFIHSNLPFKEYELCVCLKLNNKISECYIAPLFECCTVKVVLPERIFLINPMSFVSIKHKHLVLNSKFVAEKVFLSIFCLKNRNEVAGFCAKSTFSLVVQLFKFPSKEFWKS